MSKSQRSFQGHVKLGVPYESLSQSYLRAETSLGVQSVIDFTLQTNKVLSPVISERLLDLNDEFVITHFNVGIKQVVQNATDSDQLLAPVETYDTRNFGAITKYQHNGIAAIYNGDLSFTIDRTEFIPNFPMRAFYRVPDGLQSQANATFIGIPTENGASGTESNTVERLGQTETSLYGFYPSEPTKIDGRQTLDLSINLGANVDLTPSGTSATPGGTYYAVFEARGYLITNANN